jgi:hypothetical protein
VAAGFGPTPAMLPPQKAQRPPPAAKTHSHPEIGRLEHTSLLCALEYSAGRRLLSQAGAGSAGLGKIRVWCQAAIQRWHGCSGDGFYSLAARTRRGLARMFCQRVQGEVCYVALVPNSP